MNGRLVAGYPPKVSMIGKTAGIGPDDSPSGPPSSTVDFPDKTPIRVLIADDELLARRRARYLLQQIPDVEIIGEASNGTEAVDVILEKRPDAVLLDILMPDKDGFSVIETVGVERMPHIIFVTGHGQHALKAFEVHALDFLMKPLSLERLEQAIDRARQKLGLAIGREGYRQQVQIPPREGGPEKPSQEWLLVRSKGRMVLLRTATIERIESTGNYVTVHCGPERHLLRATMNSILEKLDPRVFIRIHRKHIVNIDSIKEIRPASYGDYSVVLKTGTTLRLSRTFAQKFKGLFAPGP